MNGVYGFLDFYMRGEPKTLEGAYRYQHCGKKYVDFCLKAGLIEIKGNDPAMCCLTPRAEKLLKEDILREYILKFEQEGNV